MSSRFSRSGSVFLPRKAKIRRYAMRAEDGETHSRSCICIRDNGNLSRAFGETVHTPCMPRNGPSLSGLDRHGETRPPDFLSQSTSLSRSTFRCHIHLRSLEISVRCIVRSRDACTSDAVIKVRIGSSELASHRSNELCYVMAIIVEKTLFTSRSCE